MDGLTMEQTTAAPPGAALPITVKEQWYDTAMRKVRQHYGGLTWAEICARSTRHYKSGAGLRGEGPADLVAWLHALDASPWLLPQPDAEAAVTAAYVGIVASPFLTVGAAALSEDVRLRVIRLDTLQKVQNWLQRIGPCVIEGYWTPSMDEVTRDTETIGARTDIGLGPAVTHAVALVGLRQTGVRLVNNKGVGWGALGRAWMPWETIAMMLAEDGVAWGIVPVELNAKRGAK